MRRSTAVDPPARAGRILRGDATVLKRDGSTADVHFERGEISAASATSVTVKGADGVSTTFTIGSATRLRSHGQKATADALEVGTIRDGGRDEVRFGLRRAAHPHSGRQALGQGLGGLDGRRGSGIGLARTSAITSLNLAVATPMLVSAAP